MSLARSEAFPSGWQESSLGEVCELITRGIAPSYVEEGGMLVVNQKCIRAHKVDVSVARRSDPIVKRVPSERLVRVGDVLVNSTGTGTLGRVAQIRTAPEEAATVDTHVTIVRPMSGKFDANFFGYALIAIEDQLVAGGQGAVGQTELPRADIAEKFRVRFPESMDEQKRIVAVLDQAFAALDLARANAEANLASVTDLFENTLDGEFTAIAGDAPSFPLQEAVRPDCGLSYGIVQPGEEVEGGLPIVRPVDLTRREIGLAGLKRIASDAAAGYARTTLRGGELLLCVRGTTGTVSIASSELAGANVTRGIVPIRFDEGRILRDFAYFQFSSVAIRRQVARKTYGAALMQINIKDLRELRFLVPDMKAQREIVKKSEALLEATSALRRAYQVRLIEIAALRQSLLQAAFSGQLS